VFQSIRWRLVASYAVLILLGVTLMGALALYMVQRYVGGQEGIYLKANAAAVAEQAERFMGPQLRLVALQQLAATSAFLGDARVRILDGDRQLLADSGDPGLPDEFLWLVPSGLAELRSETNQGNPGFAPSIIPVPRGRHGMLMRNMGPLLRNQPLGTSELFARRMQTPWGRSFVFEGGSASDQPPPPPPAPVRQTVSITIPIGAADPPVGFVELSSPRTLGAEALRPMRSAVLFAGLGSLLVAVAFGLLMGKTLSDPLLLLASTARRMARGDLTARASARRKDEIGQLAGQFNAMAESLEGSFREIRSERDSLKRFVADASHELRTPITALATFNELLQGSAAEDPAARQEFLKESQAQLARLQWITANLLDLSRLDAGQASLSIERHLAAQIVEAAAAGERLRAEERRVTIRAETDPALELSCDGRRMEMALSNLIANAVKFSPPGAQVVVTARADGEAALFTVKDEGPGIPPDELGLVFERFFRGRAATGDGAGLGLAIAQSVARAHGGTIVVQSDVGKGSLFLLRVPIEQPAPPSA